MSKWKDKTKRGAFGEIESSETKLGGFKLSVHRHIHHEPDTWLASCHPLFQAKPLASKKLLEAKCQAVALVQCILEDALRDIVEP